MWRRLIINGTMSTSTVTMADTVYCMSTSTVHVRDGIDRVILIELTAHTTLPSNDPLLLFSVIVCLLV
jgi:hypothetical protein